MSERSECCQENRDGGQTAVGAPYPSDGPQFLFSPRWIPLVSIALAIAVHFVIPLRLPDGLRGVAVLVGIGLFAPGLWLVAGAAAVFRSHGEDSSPASPSGTLLQEGVYQYSRNPMYVGSGLVQFGLGLVTNILALSLFACVAWVVARYVAILREERYLEERFGQAYHEYRRRVRRWL